MNPKKPARIRRLDGNVGHRPIPDETEAPKWDGTIPPFASKDARTFFNEFVPKIRAHLTFVSELDTPALTLMASAWGISMDALEKLNREGLTRDGRKNPAAQIWRDNVGLFITLSSRFGMTPADRARLALPENPAERRHSTLDGEWDPEYERSRLNSPKAN